MGIYSSPSFASGLHRNVCQARWASAGLPAKPAMTCELETSWCCGALALPSGPQRRRLGATERRHRQPYLEHQEPAALPSTATHHTFHPRLLHGRRRDELSMKVAADLFKNPAAGGAVQDPVAGGASRRSIDSLLPFAGE
jgi:hypothetical protein